MEPLFFKPIPFKTVWGGTSIKEYYGYDWMPDGTGQAWAFAAQPDGSNVCQNGPYKGMTLLDLWNGHPELFGDTNREFPLIISMLCPRDNLSIQVHPDVEHAKKYGYALGKNEAWYFLKVDEGSQIVFGHNARDEQDLRSYIAGDRWADLIRHLTVRRDDFVYVPAGTLHACCGGVIAYEVQQCTNVTYRFWDYDRTDVNGNKRELHLEKAIETLHYGDAANHESYTTTVNAYGRCERVTYMDSDSFRIEKLVVSDGEYEVSEDTYELVSVVRGSGVAGGIPVKFGDHFLIPRGEKVVIGGNLTCMMTTA